MTLYELTEQYKFIESQCYDADVDEQAFKDTLEGLGGEIEEKADGYAKIMVGMNSTIAGANKEIARLNALVKALENRKDGMKNNLESCMRETGKTKFKTALFSFNIRKNGGVQPLVIDEPEKIPEKYLIPQPAVPDNSAIRKLLAEQEVEWAHLAPRGESLVIK